MANPITPTPLSTQEKKLFAAQAINRVLGGPVMGRTEAGLFPGVVQAGVALQKTTVESCQTHLVPHYTALAKEATLLSQQTSDLEKTAEAQLSLSGPRPSAVPQQNVGPSLEPE